MNSKVTNEVFKSEAYHNRKMELDPTTTAQGDHVKIHFRFFYLCSCFCFYFLRSTSLLPCYPVNNSIKLNNYLF